MKKENLKVDRQLSSKIRKVLAEGPSTSVELSVELEISRRDAQIVIWILKNQGHIVSDSFVENHDVVGRGTRSKLRLYKLTPRGEALHKNLNK